MAARIMLVCQNSLRVEIELTFTSPNAAAQATCRVDRATKIGLALLLYESPFNYIVSPRAMP